MLFFPAWSLSTEWIIFILFNILMFFSKTKYFVHAGLFGLLIIFLGYQINIDYIEKYGFNSGIGAVGQGLLGFSIGLLIKKYEFRIKLRSSLSCILITILNILLLLIVVNITYLPILILIVNIFFAIVLVLILNIKTTKFGANYKYHLGLISYGVYLWHTVVLSVLDNLPLQFSSNAYLFMSFFITIILSYITYILIEQPFMKRGRLLKF